MSLRPFLAIQLLAFLTAEIWAFFRLRSFGLEFMEKLEALVHSGYIPIPLPHEMSMYLATGSILKTGSFFVLTLGFTLGIIAFAGAFLLHRFTLSWPIRVGWTILISAIFSFFLGSSLPVLLLLIAFFGSAHFLVRVISGPFRGAALLALIPLLLVFFIFRGMGFLGVRDFLLQRGWGAPVVSFYYQYSPMAAELITPPDERTQVTVWVDGEIESNTRNRLLKKGVYPVSRSTGADFRVPGDNLTGPAIMEAIRRQPAGREIERLRSIIYYSIFGFAPAGIMLFLVIGTNRLLLLSKHAWIGILLAVVIVSALLIYPMLWPGTVSSIDDGPVKKMEKIRQWALEQKRIQNPEDREELRGLLHSANPALRLWAADALAHAPGEEQVESLKTVARSDPEAIVRCKAIFALSRHADSRVISFLESRLAGEEQWYVKHYLFRALRRLGWIG